MTMRWEENVQSWPGLLHRHLGFGQLQRSLPVDAVLGQTCLGQAAQRLLWEGNLLPAQLCQKHN